jgi:hypothetical protein
MMATTRTAPPAARTREKHLFSLWVLWVAASVAGFAIGAAAFWVLGWSYRKADTSEIVRILAFAGAALVVTTSAGFTHWLVLRQRFDHAGWWIPASGIGSAIGFIVLAWGFAVGDTRGGDRGFSPILYGRVVPLAAIAVGGALAGAMQCFVLRRWVAHAGWWIPVSAISWVAVTWTYMTTTRGNDSDQFFAAIASGAFSGAIMGLALVFLLGNARRDGPVGFGETEGRRGE